MQGLTRDGHTSATVTALLRADAVIYDAGLDLLGPDDTLVGDISDLLEPSGSSVSWSGRADIHRACTLQLRGELDWSIARLRPWMTLTRGPITARWDLGVFLADAPTRAVDDTDIAVSVSGFDKLALLNTPIGRSYRVDAGAGYLAAARVLLEEIDPAGTATRVVIDDTADVLTLPAARTFEPDATYLAAINDLVHAVGYRSIWADHRGRFRIDPYLPPTVRPPEWTYDQDVLTSIVLPRRTETKELWQVPNEWVFVRDRPARGVASTDTDGTDGRYVVTNQSAGPASVDARGGRIVRKGPLSIDAVDQASLLAAAAQIIEADSRIIASRTFASDPHPGHDHFDVATIDDDELGTGKALWAAWTLPLDGTAMTHEAVMI